jgi:hypothetical protein
MNETPMAIPRSTPETVDTVDRNVSPPLFLKTPLHKKLHAILSDFNSYPLTHQLFIGISMLELISKEHTHFVKTF